MLSCHDECTGSSVDSRGCLLARDCAEIGAPGKQQLRSSSLCLTALSALSASLFKLLTRGGLGPLCKDSNLAGQPHCDSRSNSVSPRNALSTNNVGSFFARDVRSASVGTARTTWKDPRPLGALTTARPVWRTPALHSFRRQSNAADRHRLQPAEASSPETHQYHKWPKGELCDQDNPYAFTPVGRAPAEHFLSTNALTLTRARLWQTV